MSVLKVYLALSPRWLLGGSNEMADGKGHKVCAFISAKIRMTTQDPDCLSEATFQIACLLWTEGN